MHQAWETTKPFNYGRNKQVKAAGRLPVALANPPSWREGRKRPAWSCGAAAPREPRPPLGAALLLQKANCPRAQSPLPPLTSRMNSEANWEAGNQAGAWGNLCRLPQQLHKSMSPETTIVWKFRQQRHSSTWMKASYPACWQEDCKPSSILWMEDLQGRPQQLGHLAQAQHPAKPGCKGTVRQILELLPWSIPQVFPFEGMTHWRSLKTAHVSCRAACMLCATQTACSLAKK